MKSLNEILYSDILEEHYGGSYANPIYAVEKFGLEMGRLLSMLYVEMRSGIPYSFENRVDYLTILFELLIEVYNSFESDTLPEPREIRDIFYWYASDYCDVFLADRIMEQIDRFTHSLRISSRMPILKMTDISTDSANILRRMRWGQQDTCVRSGGNAPENGGCVHRRISYRIYKHREGSVEKISGQYPLQSRF